jgi:hypothetical protein
MSKLGKIYDAIHGTVFDDEAAPPAQPEVRLPTGPSPQPTSFAPARLPVDEHSDDDGKAYEALLARTDPMDVECLHALFDTAAKLEHTIPERAMRLRAAMATRDLSAANLAAAVQSLKNALASQLTSFEAKARQATAAQVEGAEAQVAQIKHDIEAKQQELQEKMVAIENARGRIAQKSAAFAAAHARRSRELEQLEREMGAL